MSPSPAIGWRLVPVQPQLGSAHLYDLATFRNALVAVGVIEGVRGVIWSSPNGEQWTSIAGGIPLDGDVLRSVAVGDPGIVVVGWSDTDAVAYMSADGISWSRRSLASSHGGSSAVSVAWSHGRFVAVGGGGEPNAVVSWTSTDGLAWVPLSIIEEGQGASLNSVGSGPDGFIVAGRQLGGGVVWTSADGLTWTKTDLPGHPDEDPGRVRYVNGRYLLAGSSGRLWVSATTKTWSEMILTDFGVGVFDVTAIPGGIVAVGRSADGSQPAAVAVAGADAKAWSSVSLSPAVDGFLAAAVAVSPDGVYLVGVGNGLGGESVVLFAQPAMLLNR